MSFPWVNFASRFSENWGNGFSSKRRKEVGESVCGTVTLGEDLPAGVYG